MEFNTTNTFTNQPRFVAVRSGKLWSTAHSILREALSHEGPEFRVLFAGPGWKDQKFAVERTLEWWNKRAGNSDYPEWEKYPKLTSRMDETELSLMIITK